MTLLQGAVAGVPASPLRDFSGLLYAYDNHNRAAGAYASIPDQSGVSPPRDLTVPGGAANPQGFPMNWAENGEPVIGFDKPQLQYAYDNAANATTYGGLNQPARYFALRCQLFDTGPFVTNWGGSTSNENAVTFDYAQGTRQITVYVLTKPGIIAIAATTAANSIYPGDVFTLTFRHNADKTWVLQIIREPRIPGDTQATINMSGSHVQTMDATASTYGLRLGRYGSVATYAGVRFHSVAIGVVDANTTANFISYKTNIATVCNFAFLAFDGDSPLVYPTDYFDATHWDDSGHSKVGLLMAGLEQLAVTAAGFTGTVPVGVIGDSRMAGSGATVIGVTDARAVAQINKTYTRTCNGPVNDASGTASALHYARSGFIGRTVPASQSGHSQRTPTATSIENWNGPGAAYNNVKGLTICLGVNEIVSSANTCYYDGPNELCQLCVYFANQCYAFNGTMPFIVLLNEPVTGSTTTGAPQYLIRARNREYHSLGRWLGTFLYFRMGNLNDTTYHPA